MQYGFLIDHRSCIGCHACTVACKSENDVPVGSFRTWVKYNEVGRFPDVKRHFGVLRCNHCSNAPCITICPVTALGKRADGIVDVDRDACIGCRACMQACPYDAIYLNEDHGAVEKCHFCAHRVERGLEPACVVVCPESAIVYGDLDDEASRISQMVGSLETEVRRPEQRTGPNVHYLGHEPSLLKPGSTDKPETFLWSDRPPHKTEDWPAELATLDDHRTVLDAGHKVEWGWPVALYLVTKNIAAGVMMLAPLLGVLGIQDAIPVLLPEIVALVFLGVTTYFLVEDLARPRLFLTILTRPNWNSWLVKGAFLLIAFSGTVTVALGGQLLDLPWVAGVFRGISAFLAVFAAGYTAFLFAQCEGRDLWQSKLLFPHLLAQAVLCGAACLLPFAAESLALKLVFLSAALLHLVLGFAERVREHDTDNARQAAAFLGQLRLGPFHAFRDGLLQSAVIAGVFCLYLPWAALAMVLFGLVLYEWAFVRAGQLPPLS